MLIYRFVCSRAIHLGAPATLGTNAISNFLFSRCRIGLCGFDNPMRDQKTDEMKRHIGQVSVRPRMTRCVCYAIGGEVQVMLSFCLLIY
jgi:hypothetical protein